MNPGIPAAVRFQERWRLALSLLRQVRAAGLTRTAVLADAEFGDVTAFRAASHRLRLPYPVGSFLPSDRLHHPPAADAAGGDPARPSAHPRDDGDAGPRDRGPRLGRPVAAGGLAPHHVAQWSAADAHRPIRRGARDPGPRLAARPSRTRDLVAVRRRGRHETASEALLRRSARHGLAPRLGDLAHQRWAIEQQYQELKSELGLDHFEGRTYPG